ncbi:flavin reductase family protein [Streptomyces coelicoflavus]|uniref:flavin reductase family protein n=1 Tax=Streptomyces coelicoflavus TaxID=285562 RepID=UPI0036C0371E
MPTDETFRQALGHFATGVIAVTGLMPDGGPTGMTVSSFTSVSLNPHLVSFCVRSASRTWPKLRHSEGVCINILAEDQTHVSTRLARSGEAKFGDLSWLPSPGGLPVIGGVLAWMDGHIHAEYRAGDHEIVLIRIRHLRVEAKSPPLVRFRGSFHRLQPSSAHGHPRTSMAP